MKGMLDRGFTTVRDTGGADWGIKEAVEKGDVAGPRLFIAGAAIGPTGGHSDPRRRTDFGARCHCCNAMAYTMNVSDGVSSVRKSVREQMRLGADHIKIMMSGGVASPYDPLDSMQFSVDEVKAAVEATLAALGEALASGKALAVPPLGKLRVVKSKGPALTLKLRRAEAAKAAGLALADDGEDS